MHTPWYSRVTNSHAAAVCTHRGTAVSPTAMQQPYTHTVVQPCHQQPCSSRMYTPWYSRVTNSNAAAVYHIRVVETIGIVALQAPECTAAAESPKPAAIWRRNERQPVIAKPVGPRCRREINAPGGRTDCPNPISAARVKPFARPSSLPSARHPPSRPPLAAARPSASKRSPRGAIRLRDELPERRSPRLLTPN